MNDALLPSFVSLEQRTPLAAQIAHHLLQAVTGHPADLSDTWVVVPTSGAARRIREVLAERGVLSPRFLLPMQALDAALESPAVPVATKLERTAGWSEVLWSLCQNGEAISDFLPLPNLRKNGQGIPGLAAELCTLCDQLAVGGLDPGSPALPAKLAEEAARWQELGTLYQSYLRTLQKHKLADPNEVRLQAKVRSALACRRIVVACVPDLPPIVRRCFQQLLDQGIEIEVLCWSPSGQSEHFSPWGEPDVAWWNANPPLVESSSVVAGNTPPEEIASLLGKLPSDATGDWAAFATTPEVVRSWTAELDRLGIPSYSPDGQPLPGSEPAHLYLGWEKFLTSGNLRDLRSLLEIPNFAEFVVTRPGGDFVDAQEAGAICEFLLAGAFCETWDAAKAFVRHGQENTAALGELSIHGKSPHMPAANTLLSFVEKMESALAECTTPKVFLTALAKRMPELDPKSETALALAELASCLDEVESSPLLQSLESSLRRQILRREMENRRIFIPGEADSLCLNGWLEVPWTTATHVLIAGCREGALPGGKNEDAFLPDSARTALGLPNQASLFARDAYLLSCILSRGQAVLGFSRTRERGEPNRPSRLLFGCADADLPQRTKTLLGVSNATGRTHQGSSEVAPWKLDFPATAFRPVEKLRVTAFKDYLECPFRFFLKHRMGLSEEEREARQIDRRVYGSVLHKVLEIYGLEPAMRAEVDPAVIEGFFLRTLEQVLRASFGWPLTPALQLQSESMRGRLRALARKQAQEIAAGWRIIACEAAPPREPGQAILLGGLILTGSIDRVEILAEHQTLRVLDYKTFQTPKPPQKTHLGNKPGNPAVQSALITIGTKERFWKDLQLPLYVHIARKMWPKYQDWKIEAGYFLLPPEAAEPTIATFSELDADLLSSALSCAEEIAQLVQQGVFWPPSERVQYDDFADWFKDTTPDDLLSAQTIAALHGK